MRIYIHWTSQEIDYLKKNYGKFKAKNMDFLLNNHSWSGIVCKAYKLKLKSNRSFLIKGRNNPFWNNFHSKKTKKKLSECAINRFRNTKNKFFGDKNGMYKKHHSKEAKRKMKEWWNNPKFKNKIKKFKEKRRKYMLNKNNNPSYKEEVIKKLSLASSGKNNGMYKHGKSREPYPFEWNHHFKEKIRQRDKRCVICKKRDELRRLCVHHIDGNKRNLNFDNLIALCLSHHSKIGVIQDDLRDYFKYKLLQNGAIPT